MEGPVYGLELLTVSEQHGMEVGWPDVPICAGLCHIFHLCPALPKFKTMCSIWSKQIRKKKKSQVPLLNENQSRAAVVVGSYVSAPQHEQPAHDTLTTEQVKNAIQNTI